MDLNLKLARRLSEDLPDHLPNCAKASRELHCLEVPSQETLLSALDEMVLHLDPDAAERAEFFYEVRDHLCRLLRHFLGPDVPLRPLEHEDVEDGCERLGELVFETIERFPTPLKPAVQEVYDGPRLSAYDLLRHPKL